MRSTWAMNLKTAGDGGSSGKDSIRLRFAQVWLPDIKDELSRLGSGARIILVLALKAFIGSVYA